MTNNNNDNKNNLQPGYIVRPEADYTCCSLNEYFKVLETQETEKRVLKSLKKFNGYVNKLLDDNTNK